MKRSGRCLLALLGSLVIAAPGCASTVTLTAPPTAKLSFTAPARPVRAHLGETTGAQCFRDELARALGAPGGIELAPPGAPADLSLSGKVDRIDVHSNRGDKEALMLYYTAFVITAPLAAAVYGAKDWHADATGDGELNAVDGTGRAVWRKALTVSVSETQRTMPTDEALKTAMQAAACRKLAVTLLNALTEAIAADPTLVAH